MIRAPRVALLFLFLALAGVRAAAAPWNVNFQGSLTQDGLPVNSTRTIDLSIFDGASALRWQASGLLLSVSTGIFRTAIPDPGLASFDPGPVRIQTVIHSTDAVNDVPVAMPMQTVHSSMFALAAASAAVLTGAVRTSAPGPHWVNGDTLGIGWLTAGAMGGPSFHQETPAVPLFIGGALDLRGSPEPPRHPAPSSDAILYFDSGSNKFRVSQGGSAWRDLVPAAGPDTFVPGGNAFGTTAVLGPSNATPLVLMTATRERLRLDSGGVMVGTGTSYGLFTVGNGTFVVTSAGHLAVGGYQGGFSEKLTIINGDLKIATPGRGIYFPDGTFLSSADLGTQTGFSAAGNAAVTSDSDSDGTGRVVFKTGGVERMTLLPSGRIGIANANPSQQFVVGNGSLTLTAEGWLGIGTLTPQGPLTVSSAGATSPIVVTPGTIAGVKRIYTPYAPATDSFAFTALESDQFTRFDALTVGSQADTVNVMASRASLGVGASTPTARLSIHGSSNDYLLFVSTRSDGSTPNLAVDAAGFTGIGTSSPQSLLQVGGDYLQIPSISGTTPPAGDCAGDADSGRLVVRRDGSAGARLYLCQGGTWVAF